MTENFTAAEMACSHCGECNMDTTFMILLQQLRDALGPLRITSAYRCDEHTVELNKKHPGTHNSGIAADVACDNVSAYNIQKEAYRLGFTGIARGNGFVHLDIRETTPVSWQY
jgi:uncharacterized protein YcbK (DUF882 family)